MRTRFTLSAWGYVKITGGERKTAWAGLLCKSVPETRLLAAIAALESIEAGTKAKIVVDDSYTCHGASKWLPKWKIAGWCKANGQPVAHLEHWRTIDTLIMARRVPWLLVSLSKDHEQAPRLD